MRTDSSPHFYDERARTEREWMDARRERRERFAPGNGEVGAEPTREREPNRRWHLNCEVCGAPCVYSEAVLVHSLAPRHAPVLCHTCYWSDHGPEWPLSREARKRSKSDKGWRRPK